MSGYIGTQPVPQATQTRDAFTATAGQTSFATSGYTPSFLDVFLNGVKLSAADYTASNGSDVVLASGAATGDILEVVAYTTFDTANVTGADDFTVTGSFTSQGIDDNATSTAMTLDGSGNLMVGTTSFTGTSGVSLSATGYVYASSTNDVAIYANRETSDGDIAVFRKDGSTVGSIGSEGGSGFDAMYVANGDTGLIFQGYANDAIIPFTAASLDKRDAAIDLGYSAGRFKDLYLSGGVYLGGTGSANKLDDYEEGTWSAVSAATSATTMNTSNSTYTKIGRLVTCYTTVGFLGASGTLTVSGLPFAVNMDAGLGWGREDATSGYGIYYRAHNGTTYGNGFYMGGASNASAFQVASGNFRLMIIYYTNS